MSPKFRLLEDIASAGPTAFEYLLHPVDELCRPDTLVLLSTDRLSVVSDRQFDSKPCSNRDTAGLQVEAAHSFNSILHVDVMCVSFKPRSG